MLVVVGDFVIKLRAVFKRKVETFRVGAKYASPLLDLVLRGLLTWQFGFLVKVGQCLEESEDLWLRKDVGENAEVDAESLKTFEIHLQSPIRIELVEGKHRLVHDIEHVHYALVLKNLKQFCDLSRCICANAPI